MASSKKSVNASEGDKFLSILNLDVGDVVVLHGSGISAFGTSVLARAVQSHDDGVTFVEVTPQGVRTMRKKFYVAADDVYITEVNGVDVF